VAGREALGKAALDLDPGYVAYLYDLVAQIQGGAATAETPLAVAALPVADFVRGEASGDVLAFVKQNPDFQMLTIDKTVIIYDPDARDGSADVYVKSIEFSDGSMIVLVGLADPALSWVA
jgi:hypothetical protein